MKKNLKTIMYLLLAIPLVFTGCQKSDLTDNSAEKSAAKTVAVNCGTPMVYNIYELQQVEGGTPGTISYGTVTISNDATNLYVKYSLLEGWVINYGETASKIGAHLFVGSEAQLLATHTGVTFEDENSVHLWENNLGPYRFEPKEGPGVNEYTFTIPRNTIYVDCPYIVALVDIKNTQTGVVKTDLSARAYTKCYAYYFQYCWQSCGSGSCETAYAKANQNSTCFLGLAGVNANNWGWSNQVTSSGTWDWPIWAGAGQCETSKGTQVGTLHVSYDGKNVTVKYNLFAGFKSTGTHLWVGNTYLPMKNGKYVTAPGQFEIAYQAFYDPSTESYGPIPMTAPFYIAAHMEVCW
jgi:hypothetical protein